MVDKDNENEIVGLRLLSAKNKDKTLRSVKKIYVI